MFAIQCGLLAVSCGCEWVQLKTTLAEVQWVWLVTHQLKHCAFVNWPYLLNLLSHYRGKHLYRSSKILCALSHQELTAGVIGLCVFADISQSD